MKKTRRLGVVLASILAIGAITTVTLKTLADVPVPVLTIAPLGSNQFSIIIANAGSTSYTLFWTPILADDNYPWQVLTVSTVGQTNFTVDGGEFSIGFFGMLVGADSDGDGIPDWQDAAPADPSIGILDLTINTPLNGAVVQ